MNHAGRNHALLSASGAHRWLNCPPSAMLEAELPDSTSVYAMEGTLAHEICEVKLRSHLGAMAKSAVTRHLNKLKRDKLFDEEMIEYADGYVDYIIEKTSSNDAVILVEERLDFSEYVPEGFGTGDCIIIQDGTLTVIDFKYGKGVPVFAENNPQMKLYALGAIEMFGFIYDFDKVEMCIYQPRISNISESVMSVKDLTEWGNCTVKPTAAIAIAGGGEFNAGEHCTFCKMKNRCRKLADYCLETVKEEFEDLDGNLDKSLLEPDDIAMIVGRIKTVQNWLKDVESYAINGMLEGKLEVPGYKVVEGRSNRKFTDQDKVIDILLADGYPEFVIYKPKELVAMTNLEKLIGKKKFHELIGEYIEKPKGKPTLAPVSDKRPVYTTADDFEDES